MTKQMKISSEHISALKVKLENCEDTSKTVKDEKDNVASKAAKLVEEKKQVEGKLSELKKESDTRIAETDDEVSRLREEKQIVELAKDKLQEELDRGQSSLEECKISLEAKAINVTTCAAELASERADRLLVPPGGVQVPPRHLPPVNGLGPGQLPDVKPGAVNIVKKETLGENGLKILPPPNSSSSSKAPPVMAAPSPVNRGISSTSEKADKQLVDNAVGVLAQPPPVGKGNDNLDNAEDDSQIVENVNGPEGKKDLTDDDQDPDGQIDETVDVEKQQYLVDKAQAAGDSNDEGKDVGVDLSGENADNLDNLKKSLNESEDKEQ